MYPVKTDDMFHAILAGLKRTITKFILSVFRLYLVCLYWIYSGFILFNREHTGGLHVQK